MKDEIEDKRDSRENAKVGNPRRNKTRADPYKEKILSGYRDGKMLNFPNGVSNALLWRHLRRSLEDNVDQSESASRLVTSPGC